MATEFIWNTAKGISNSRKHDVDFDTAARAFADEFLLTEFQGFVGDEPRWQTTAMVDGILLLMIIHTDWEENGTEIVRIISARHATAHERKRYEQNRYENHA
jgi:uncharacterized protein